MKTTTKFQKTGFKLKLEKVNEDLIQIYRWTLKHLSVYFVTRAYSTNQLLDDEQIKTWNKNKKHLYHVVSRYNNEENKSSFINKLKTYIKKF